MATRANLLVCAVGTLCVFLAGCGADQQLSVKAIFQGNSVKDTFVVGGTMDSVAAKLKVEMAGLGLTVQEQREGETIRLVSQSGPSRFAVVLSQVQSENGQRIQAKIEWIDKRDELMNTQVLGLAVKFIVRE